MKNDEQHITEEMDEPQPIPSSHEIMEYKRAFNRMHVPAPDTEAEWQKFCKDQQMHMYEMNSFKRKRLHLLVGFAAGVAASVMLFFFVSHAFLKPTAMEPVQVFNAVQNIDGVTLTSETGESHVLASADVDSLLLSKGIRANSNSFAVVPSNKMQDKPTMITLTTPRGKDYQVTLSDGSKVWLNADSKLVFPEYFSGDKRTVTLHGEAFFEIQKDEKHPFEVHNNYFTTSVLGTEFNVKAYTPNDASVVLVAGKVSLKTKGQPQATILQPGQKAQWQEKDGFAINQVDTYNYVQWKEGYFYFNNIPLIDILQELGRWYNVDILFENSQQMNTRLHFVTERNQSLESTLQRLNSVEVVHADLKNNKIIIR